MKIAITAKGDTLDSDVDPRFGRAAYILVVDTETLAFEVIDNAVNQNAFKGAGIQAATSVCDKDAEILLTGFCGPNAFETLAEANIKVANDQTGTVMETVNRFKEGNVVYSEQANTEGHW